uniref:Uncharacterized protein n=1 Tax=Salix viminalis TaxID=40686 RepID=A0A6N2LQ48_SALVM
MQISPRPRNYSHGLSIFNHLVVSTSLARLAMRNYSGALEDAREALRLAPRYLDAYMCEGDVFMAMEEYDAAEKSYLTCLQIDPSIRHSGGKA